MAVKGSATVTLSQYRDTESVTRYYKLQSSYMAAPDKPANVKPNETPAGWSKAEPACDITKTLYTCDVTVFSDKTTHVSDVSKSTSYEAAKEAWNKANNAQGTADAAKKFTDSALNNYGYQYKVEIEVAGDPNTYYPVMISGPTSSAQDVMREILVKRSYNDKCPPEWNGHLETKGISLTLKVKCKFGGWGGAQYDWRIHDLNEYYGHVFAGCKVDDDTGTMFYIFLRGGGATYIMYSDMEMDCPCYYNPTTTDAPSVWLNGELVGWNGGTAENPKYAFYAPQPRTYTDAVIKEVHDRTYIKVATDAYDKAGTAQNTADKAQSSADKAQNTATEAAKTADNYISADSTGIMVSENKGATKETPSNATKNNVLITEKDVQIRNGKKILASYGRNTIIGPQNGNHFTLSPDAIKAKTGDIEILEIIFEEGIKTKTARTDFRGEEVIHDVLDGHTITIRFSLGEEATSITKVTLHNRYASSEDLDMYVDNSKSWIQYSYTDGLMSLTIVGSNAEAQAVSWDKYYSLVVQYTPKKQYDSTVTCDNLIAKGKLKAGRSITTDYAEISGTLAVGLGIDISNEKYPSISYRDNAGRRGDLIRIKDGRGTLTLKTGAVSYQPRWWRCGNIVQMEVATKCTGEVASGANIADGKITGVPKPITESGVRAVSYYGNNSNISYMGSDGTFYARNAGADALKKNNDCIGGFTYITDGTML